jgi:hypothetical protein
MTIFESLRKNINSGGQSPAGDPSETRPSADTPAGTVAAVSQAARDRQLSARGLGSASERAERRGDIR